MTEKDLIIQLSTAQGFYIRFVHHLRQDNDISQKAAYEATEAEYKAIFHRRRYSGYNSFRKTKNRLLRNNS